VAEPTTVATDLALAGVAVVLAALLRRSARPLPRSRGLWVAAFLLSAVAAIAGAWRHALFEETASVARRQLWLTTYLALGFTNLAFLAGLVRALLPRSRQRLALAALVVRCAVYSALLLIVPAPRLVIADAGVSLGLILAFSLYSLLATREGAGSWLLAGLGLSAAGALVQVLRIGPLGPFNHNDLFHLVQMGGLWLFYRAGLRFRDRPGVEGERSAGS
jgi:predicted membrane channel-forming protein YqfA (hemolysin III family)